MILLVVALVVSFIPMDGQMKGIGYIVIGVVAIVLFLRFTGII